MTKGLSAKPKKEGQFLFGSDFLHDHVGQIIDEPTVAILELVANSYDAGADRVGNRVAQLAGRHIVGH
jgi:hypothetical protein